MSKGGKRVKSGNAAPVSGSKWENALHTTPLEEDNWKANITFVVGNAPEDYSHIKLLGNAVASGTRKLFSLISKDDLYQEVNDLGNPKAKKTKEVPANYEVCEACKLHLDIGDEIPLPLLAKLIKYKLLHIKIQDQKRRENEKKAANDLAKGKKDKGKERGKSPKKGGKKTPEPPSAKEGSKLRKRGDEDHEKKFIDDEPDDGAQHYIIVYGFLQPYIFSQLAEIGVNVNCILRMSNQDYSVFEMPPPDSNIEKDEKTILAEEAARDEQKMLKKNIDTFWKDILLILQKNPDSSKLHDVAIEDYEVKKLLIPENIDDPEQKLNFMTTLFEDIACKIYDLIDAKRLYGVYLDNLKLTHIPVIGQTHPSALDGQSTASVQTPGPPVSATTLPPDSQQTEPPVVDMRFYNDLMNCVPQESVSVSLIMHSMLEQVVATEENKEPPSEQKPPQRPDGLNNDLAAYLSSLAFKLPLSEEEHSMLAETIDLPKIPSNAPKQPLLMNYHDKATVRTHKLQHKYDFDPKEVEENMLQFSPFSDIVKLERPTSAVAKERSARLQELIHFCATGVMSQSEIDRAFKQFLFECMDLTTTDPNGFILTREGEGLEHTAIPWDDPYPFFKGMIPHHEKHLDIPVTMSTSPTETEEDRNKTPLHDRRSSRVGFCDTVSRENLAKEIPSIQSLSRPSSEKGILKSRSRSQSPERGIRSRSNSVHFIKEPGEPLPLSKEELSEFVEIKDVEIEKSIEDTMMEVVDAQKRQLNEWCYAEHFEPNVLLQVLTEASYSLPFVNTYYNKRDHSLMLVMHSPHNAELQNHVDWHTELHSNMGFRNYMEYVCDSIGEWLKEKQAEYEAKMLSAELEKMHAADESEAKLAEKQRQSESPKKSRQGRSKSPKTSRSTTSQDRVSNDDTMPLIREGSLKAQKEEADRLKAEEEEKEHALKLKRSKSAQKREEKEKEEKEKKRPGSRGSAKSKTSQKELETQSESLPLDLQEEEKFWPFQGYDVGNNLIHVSGIVTSLFPSDGGQIRIEKTEFVQGTTSVKSTVLKDGHVFAVHILNPKEDYCIDDDEEESKVENVPEEGEEKKDLPEKSESEKLEKENIENVIKSSFGSVTATLNDGMTIAVSQFGPTGEAVEGKKYEPEPYIPPVCSPTPVSQPPSPSKGKKSGEKAKEKVAPTPEPPQIQTEEPDVQSEETDGEKELKQSFQELFLTCPDGLNVRYFLESSLGIKPNSELDRRLVVKQSYPFKTKGLQSCESTRKKYMSTEVSRVITSEGTVVKTMVDGTVEVLYADGTISNHTGRWPSSDSRTSSPQRAVSARSCNESPTRKSVRSKGSGKNLSPKKSDENKVEEIDDKTKWVTTYPNGERFSVRGDGTVEDLKPVMICLASDPETKQSMATRDDKVVTVSYPDGTTIVEHSDGTRITTYYCESQTTSEDNEENSDETPLPEIRTTKFVKVECPAYATVEFNCSTSENLTIFGNNTSVNVFPDGFYMIQHIDGGRIQVDTEGTVTYYSKPDQLREDCINKDIQYVLRHNADVVCETVDADGNVFNVKHTGDFSVMMANSEDCLSSEGSVDSQSCKQREKINQYSQHAPRFFIVHADGSGTELLRYKDVAEYLTQSDKSAATAVCKDPISDYPGVMGITVLKPYIGGPSETWFKKYDLDSIIPNGIRSRDLISLPPKEYKTPGPKFGTNVGQGLAVGAAVKSPTRVAIVKCPDVLELRQLVQYNPVSEKLRVQLCNGLREYAEYVMDRNKAAEMMQVNDPRSQDEQQQASDLNQTIDVERQTGYDPARVKELYEKATTPQAPSPPPTPQPKRKAADWEKDQREIALELEGKNLLKNKNIPQYFDSELGKAFLLTQAKDDDEMIQELSEDPRRDGTEAIRADTSSLSYDPQSQTPNAGRRTHSQPVIQSENSDQSVGSVCLSPAVNGASQGSVKLETPISSNTLFSADAGITPSGIRPLNPTPAHATGQGSPAPVRPTNPTPSKTDKSAPLRPGNPTPKHAGGVMGTPSDSDLPNRRKSQMTIPEEDNTNLWMSEVASRESDTLTKSLRFNVIGEPRSDSVSLPESIMGARPGAEKNASFAEIEEPVRRKVNNIAVAGANSKGKSQLEKMRGLNLLPDQVNFGVLREGYTYSYSVYLKNTGVDTCRFKVKQPPPATGLQVLFKPGPVAAGMRTELHLELYAIAVGVEGESGVGGIEHNLQIITETDCLSLPVRATILTAHEFERRMSQSSNSFQRTAGTQLISTKPPSSTGIIRPRKDNLLQEISAR